jgi:DNA-binding transcriptional regulator GbsR (MarR family)
MKLTPVMERYVLHWGEMGERWGVNRSVAQIHALLYIVAQPLHAEEISETLGLARSNVSNSLRELQGWELVSLTHVLGDRRDYFEAKQDLWEVFLTLAEQRKKREVDPTIAFLKELSAEAEKDPQTSAEVRIRIERLQQFIGTLDGWYGQVRRLPKDTLVKLMNLGSKIAKFVGR